jgi:hypothetical protein
MSCNVAGVESAEYNREQLRRVLRWAMWALVVAFLVLRFWHLSADFPNYSFWHDDHAKFTDEGWYANAALNSIFFGSWYVPGDWAPATTVPVWPLLMEGVLHVTGVGIVPPRATEAAFSIAILFFAWLIFRRSYSPTISAAFALLLASSATAYAFSRVAILEAPLVAFTLLALWIATGSQRIGIVRCVVIGAVIPFMVLTKTTGAFLIPAVLYPVWFYSQPRRDAWKKIAAVLLTAGVILGAEWLVFARHYAADAQAFYSQSEPHLLGFETLRKAVRLLYRGIWIDRVLWPFALLALIVSFFQRALWRNVLWGTCVLWILGYSAFIVYHFDGPPRYFTAMVVPVFMMCVIFSAWLMQQKRHNWGAIVCAIALALNLSYIVKLAMHPQYTMLSATQQVRETMADCADCRPLMIGHGDNEIGLYSAIPSLDDRFGTATLEQKMDWYHPGWVVVWNDESPADLEQQMPGYSLVLKKEIPALDDSRRCKISVYQVVPR